jgi:hypothetical protein
MRRLYARSLPPEPRFSIRGEEEVHPVIGVGVAEGRELRRAAVYVDAAQTINAGPQSMQRRAICTVGCEIFFGVGKAGRAEESGDVLVLAAMDTALEKFTCCHPTAVFPVKVAWASGVPALE